MINVTHIDQIIIQQKITPKIFKVLPLCTIRVKSVVKVFRFISHLL